MARWLKLFSILCTAATLSGCGAAGAAKAVEAVTSGNNQNSSSSSSSTSGTSSGASTTTTGGSSASTNNAPVFATPEELSVSENQRSVVLISVTDQDDDDVALSKVGGADSDLFNLLQSGELTFIESPDYEAPGDADSNNVYLVTIEADDGEDETQRTFSVNVQNLLEGFVVDGPLKNSSVFLDLNGDRSKDEDEPEATSDTSGYFELADESNNCNSGICDLVVIATGGTDTSTNENVELSVYGKAVGDQQFSITPLSTVFTESSNVSEVITQFELTGTEEEILLINPWVEASSGQSRGQDLLKVNQQIGVLLETANTIAETDTSTIESARVSQAVAQAITEKIENTSSSTLSLAEDSTVTEVLASALTTLNTIDAVESNELAAIAQSVSEINEVIASKANGATSATVLEVVANAQDDLQDSIQDLANSSITATEFVAATNSEPDSDGDGTANKDDLDDDNDGVNDDEDAFSLDPNETVDTDGDGIGNNADTDDDGDGIADSSDAFPLDAGESLDTDSDGIGNVADNDDDGDGYTDDLDAFPLDPNEYLDSDSDGIGNNTDSDDDADGYADSNDAFPLDALEYIDTDGDGIGNNSDDDDDGDGVADVDDQAPLDANIGAADSGSGGATDNSQGADSSSVEVEDNNVASNANSLTSGAFIDGAIADSDDVDWFVFDAPEAGSLKIKFDVDEVETYGWVAILYDLDSNGSTRRLARLWCGDADCQTNGAQFTAGIQRAGNVWLAVQNAYVDGLPANAGYRITPTFTSGVQDVELEYNDADLIGYSAQSIDLNQTVNGNVYGEDKDFFKINLSDSGRFQVNLQVIASSDTGLPRIRLFDCDPGNSDCAALSEVAGTTIDLNLKAGTYYIGIDSADGFEHWEYTSYSVTAVFDESGSSDTAVSNTSSGFEYEPNDSLQSAQQISTGVATSGSLAGSSDQDWYSIEVTEQGSLTAQLTVDSSEYYGWLVKIRDSQGNVVARFACNSSTSVDCKDQAQSVSTGVLPGTYYVEIVPGSNYSSFSGNGSYELLLSSSNDSTGAEFESNDVTSSAQSIDSSSLVNGSISGVGDVDYYEVNLPSAGTFTATLQGGASEYYGWVVTLLDSSGNTLGSFVCDGGDCTINGQSVKVGAREAGSYYVAVSSGSSFSDFSYNGAYTLSVSTDTNVSGIEFEPNENSAQLLSSGDTIKGSLYGTNDIDWYAVEVSSAGSLTAKLDVDKSEYYGWSVQVKDADNNILGAFVCSSSASIDCKDAGQSIKVGLQQAGTYYVQIISGSSYSSFDNNGAYELTITTDNDTSNIEFEPNYGEIVNALTGGGYTFSDESTSLNKLTSGQPLSGSLYGPDDKDLFYIEVSEKGTLTARLDVDWSEYYGWKVLIIDDDFSTTSDTTTANEIASFECSGGDCQISGEEIKIGVLPGNYWIQVVPVSSYSEFDGNGAYQLTITTNTETSGIEYEPNEGTDGNSFTGVSQTISSGTSIIGAIGGGIGPQREDRDWYAIEFSSAGTLKVDFQSIENSSNAWKILVFDKDQNHYLGIFTCGGQVCQDSGRSISVGIAEAGTYYVSVRSEGSRRPEGNYRVTATALTGTTGVEYEPNDATSNATPITLGTAITGYLMRTESDEDFYSFSASTNGTITFRLDVNESAYYGWEVKLLDDQNNLLGSFVCDGSDCASNGEELSVGVSAGDYYLVVTKESTSSDPSDTGEYTLLATFSGSASSSGNPPDFRFEPNNDAANAQLISTDVSFKGAISNTDEDWYKVEVKDGTDFKVKLDTTVLSDFGWKVRIWGPDSDLNATNTALVSFDCSSTSCQSVGASGEIIGAGASSSDGTGFSTYYVQVTLESTYYGIDAYSDGSYSLSLIPGEANDHKRNASLIRLVNGTSDRLEGSLHSSSDKNWYIVTLPNGVESPNLKLNFQVDAFSSDGPEYTFSLQNHSNYRTIGYCSIDDVCGPNLSGSVEAGDDIEANFKGDDSADIYPAGTYFILINDSSTSDWPGPSGHTEAPSESYSLQASYSTSGNVAREIGSGAQPFTDKSVLEADLDHPNWLQSGQAIKGNLSHTGDRDNYAFVAPSGTDLMTVDFRASEYHPEGANIYSYYVRTLGDDGNYTSLNESEGIGEGATALGLCGNANFGTLCDSNESRQHHPLKISVTAGQTYWVTVYMDPISDGVPGNEYFLTVTGS